MSTDFFGTSNTIGSVRAPTWPSYAVAACSILALVLVLPGSQNLAVSAVGYALGGLMAPALTVVHRFMQRAARKNPFYIPSPTTVRVVQIMLAVGILAGVLNAWFIATELAKQ